jgi:hypothetical protein
MWHGRPQAMMASVAKALTDADALEELVAVGRP